MTTLKVSRGMGNHLLCVRYTKSGVHMNIIVEKINRTPFMIVHHMKNAVSICVSMMFLSYLSASNQGITRATSNGPSHAKLSGDVGLHGLFSKNKYEHASHDTKDGIAIICPGGKSISCAANKAEDAEA